MTPLLPYTLTDHALEEIERRGINPADVDSVLRAPEQVLRVREGRVVAQSRSTLGDPPREYLVRVFVDIDRMPREVVTAYRTSKVLKYWSPP